MTVAEARVHRFDLPLRRAHVTAAGTIAARSGYLLELVGEDGSSGWGEAAPLDPAELGRVAEELARFVADPAAAGEPCLVVAAAIDTARLDLAGQRDGVPLARLLSRHARPDIAVNALVTAASPTAVAAEVGTAVDQGFTTVKLKVAASAPEVDVERVAVARDVAGPSAVLRLDANRGWDLDTAVDVLGRVAGHDIDYVEEPVASPAGFGEIRARTGMAIAADESLDLASNVDGLLADGAIDVAVLKPSVVGGPTATMDLAHRCRDVGVGVVVSSALDAAVGLVAALHVAAAVEHRGAAGLATSSLLAADVADPPAVEAGRLAVPDGPGLGLGELQL